MVLWWLLACVVGNVDGDGFSPADGDCDDTIASIHPGAEEHCNGADDDCDGTVDSHDAVDAAMFYVDLDGDGAAGSVVVACVPPDGASPTQDDCDDASAAVGPDAEEVCDGVDQDCDGAVDEGTVATESWTDADGDGFGDPDGSVWSCGTVDETVDNAQDCDDEDPSVHPEATEVCGDGADNDCDGRGCGVEGVSAGDAVAEFVGNDQGGYAGETLLLADTDGDGLAEPVIGQRNHADAQGRISTYLDPNLEDGNLGTLLNLDSPDALSGLGRSLATGDLGCDGTVQLLAGGVRYDNGEGAVYQVSPDLQTYERLIVGTQAWASLGRTVAAGDLDDDGCQDLVVGAESMDVDGIIDPGEVYIAWGPVTGAVSSDLDAIHGAEAGADLGRGLHLADVTGDGLADLIAAAPGHLGLPEVAHVYVVNGPVTRGLDNAASDVADAVLEGGFSFGYALASADLDDDGRDDLLVATPEDGLVQVFTNLPETGSALQFEGEFSMGAALVTGDLDGNGQADVIAGIPGRYEPSAGGSSDAPGAIAIWLGPGEGLLLQSDAQTVLGDWEAGYLGTGLAAGDMNGDGRDDLLVGAPGTSDSASDGPGVVGFFLGAGF